jgi:hypothetical protein
MQGHSTWRDISAAEETKQRDLLFQLDEKKWLLVEDKQVRCVQHSVCATNRQLVGDLGPTGKALGRYLKLVHVAFVLLCCLDVHWDGP